MRVAIPGSWTARLSLGGLLALAAMQLQAQAQPQTQDIPKITPFVEETVTTDDNLFRISNQVDPLLTEIDHIAIAVNDLGAHTLEA